VASQCDSEVLTMFRHNILVWELMVALWGSLPEFEHIDGEMINSIDRCLCVSLCLYLEELSMT